MDRAEGRAASNAEGTSTARGMCGGRMRADLLYGSIPAMARSSAVRYGDAPAVIDGDVVLSFRDVADTMRRVAASLIANGVRPGDRIGLWAPNCAAWIPVALGIQAAGAWLVPLNTRYLGAEAAHILRASDARALFVPDSFRDVDYVGMLTTEDPSLRCLDDVIRIPGPGEATAAAWTEFLARGADVSDDDIDAVINQLEDRDVCDVIFTSGTTGAPKGVLLAHGPSLRCYESYNTAFGLDEGQRQLVANPFFHCFGYKAGWMLGLLVGAVTVPMAVFDPSECLALIERERVTHMPGSPTLFWSMINHPDRSSYDISSLQTVMVAAASIPVELVDAVRSELGVSTVLTGYGLTENHALGTFSRPQDDAQTISTTVGQPAPDLEMRIVDEIGEPVPTGSQGELEIRGYARMLGYLDDEVSTRAAFHDGWLRTGDVAVIDDRGYVSITDRKKDIYVMGGFNVAPAEVEAALMNHPGIAEVAVVGMPDAKFGEVGAAFVVAKRGSGLTADDVTGFARTRLANFKVPRRVDIVDGLPHNATGKVLKGRLREQLGDRAIPAAGGVRDVR
jgi:acyl-CoA synthetase (AMP-forming)/AMP-acid ligase II